MASADGTVHPGPPLRVHLLGPFEVEGFGTTELGSRKARVFLQAMALGRGRAVSADRLADIVWGDDQPAKPGDQLSVLASRLRRVLGPDRIERVGAGYRLRAEWFDLDEVEELAADAHERLLAGSPAAARVSAAAALRLVRGELLADEVDAEWIESDRRAAARLVSRLSTDAAAAELDGGDAVAAAGLAEQALDHDPYDEAALRLLMRAHRAAGRPASALASYAEVRRRLRDDLGVHPTAETEALHDELLVATDDTASRDPIPVGDDDASDDPLPGRSAQLAVLDEQLTAMAGGARLVVVAGEAGIGKSTLLDHFAARAACRGALVLQGRCDEFAAELPLQALVDALARHLDRLEPADVEAVLGAERLALDPLLGRVDVAGVPAAGDIGQSLLFASLLTVFGRLAPPTGLVVVIDDLHFVGDSTRDWLRFFQRRGGRARVLVVVGTRGWRDELEAAATVELGPLDLAAAAAIVGADRAGELLARSGGHPLFLVELAASAPGDQGAPDTIRAAVARRLRQIGPAGDALLVAAVLGPSDLDLLAAVTERSPIAVLDDLEIGAREGFLQEDGASYAFRHALVREALTTEVSAARRAWLHRAAATRLDARRPRGDLAEIVHHARLGGEASLTARALTGTADLAMSRYAYAEAVRSLDEAIELDDRPEARLLRGRARIVRADFAGAIDDALRVIELGAGAPGHELASWAADLARDLAAAEAHALEGARLAEDPVVRASCLTVAGRIVHGLGRLGEADQLLSEALELAGAGAPVTTGVWLARLRIHQSRDDEALRLAVVSPAVERDPIAATFRLIAVGHALGHLGRPAESLARFDELDRLMDEIGYRRYEGTAQNWRGWLLRYLGEPDAARDHNEQAESISRATGFSEGIAHALLDRADLALLGGDLAAAGEWLDQAAPYHEMDHPMWWRHALRGQLLRAHLEALVGDDRDKAADASLAVVEAARQLGVERFAVLGGLVAVMAGARPVADLDALVGRLPVVAGTEAWWWLARLHQVTGDDRWLAAAERSAADLLPRAGAHRESLATFARNMTTRGR